MVALKRLQIVTLRAGGPPESPVVLDDGFVATLSGRLLRIYDIRSSQPRLILELSGTIAIATAGNAVLVLDDQAVLTRWDYDGERWVSAFRFQSPLLETGWGLAAAPSGRVAYIDGSRGYLVDLEGVQVVAEIAAHGLVSANPYFAQLKDGREVLFVSAPTEGSVQMLDAKNGGCIAKYEDKDSVGFCHVDFKLSLNGLRLVTFGGAWACPYEVRMYDATPWMKETRTAPFGFPLSVIRSIQPLAANGLLPTHVEQTGGYLINACLEDRALLRDPDRWLSAKFSTLRNEEPELAQQLDAVSSDDPVLVIARRVNSSDGRTERSFVQAIPAIEPGRVHYATEERIVIAGARLIVCHMQENRLDDLGELRLDTEARTAITPNAAHLIVVRP